MLFRSVGVVLTDDELVSLALLGLPKSWYSYQDSVNGREKLPDWERLWSNLVQATNCPQKKARKKEPTIAAGEALAS